MISWWRVGVSGVRSRSAGSLSLYPSLLTRDHSVLACRGVTIPRSDARLINAPIDTFQYGLRLAHFSNVSG
jgi:hypothetical protein